MTEQDRDARADSEPAAVAFEPAPAGVAVAPVAGGGPRSGLRWAVALGLAAVIVAVSAAGAWLLTGRDAGSGLAAWMPADSVVYEELRFDLPGDQRQELGTFLAHFPGFDDQAILDQKLAEVYDRVIRAATRDAHDFSTEIKPWFGGQVAVALAGLPEPGAGGSAPSLAGHGLAAVSVTDPAAALAWLRKVLDGASASYSTVDHGGTSMLVIGGGANQAAAAARGQVLLLGDRTSVERSLDANGSGGLASSDAFRAAQAANDADRLVGFYVDVGAYLDWAMRLGASADPSMAAGLGSLAAGVPAWIAGSVRAEGDALVADAAYPHPASLPVPPNAPTALAGHLPATTLFACDVNDYGATLLGVLDRYRTSPALSGAFAQIDQAAQRLGGFDKLIGWIGETAVVVGQAGGSPTAGLVVVPRDRAAADALARQVHNLIALAGASSGVTTREEQYAGTTITTLVPAAAGGQPGVAQGGQSLTIAWAITDQVAVIGLGDAFVEQVLDTKADSSLGSDARFEALVGRVGDHNGLLFADLTRIRELVETAMSPAQRAGYEANVKPYLVPFDALVGATRRGSDLDTMHLEITVEQ